MNKNGWGLRAELGFLLLFLICLLVATIGLQRIGLFGKDNHFNILENGDVDYSSLENKIVEAASSYYNIHYPNGTNDTLIIGVDTLKSSGYLTPLYDSRNKECKGYAKILRTDTIVGYIRCSNYKTVGYSEDNE